MLLFTGLEKRNAEVILSGFQAMASLTKAQVEELSALIRKELALPGQDTQHFDALLCGARHLAVPMDEGVLAFNAGRLHLERQLEAFEQLLKSAGLQHWVPSNLATVYHEAFSKALRSSKVLLGPKLGNPK